MPKGTIYYPPEFERVWKAFLKICEREGKTASEKIRKYVIREVEIHGPGNPQTIMNSFSEGGKVDVGVIEGRIRQYFFDRYRRGLEVRRRDILNKCKLEFENLQLAVRVSERVTAWLWGQGIRIWR